MKQYKSLHGLGWRLGIGMCCAFAVCNIACAQDDVEDSLDRDYSAELPRFEALSPGEALSSFEVQPGFKVDQVAAEPLVSDPIALSFDAAGRMYVVEMRGYSEQYDDNAGVIALLEDTDNDGHFDKRSEFMKNLAWPTAVTCYDGGVFVGCAP